MDITIYSDNQAYVKALSGSYTRSRLNVVTHATLRQVGLSNNLTLEWIPGHSDYSGNEMADKLAKRGCSNPAGVELTEPILPVSESVVNAQIRKWAENAWMNRWRNSIEYRRTKIWIQRPRIRNNSPALAFDRQVLSKTTGIITGHIWVRKHLYNIGVSTDPLCDCGEEESASHIVAECPTHVMNRLLHLEKPIILYQGIGVLDYNRVLSFFMATGILDGTNSKVSTDTVSN